MEKDEILRMSREENFGRQDEREILADGNASRAGMLVGGILCAALALASRLLLHIPEVGLAGWLVYFAMQGSGNIVLHNHRNLILGIAEIIFAAAFAVALVVKSVVPQ